MRLLTLTPAWRQGVQGIGVTARQEADKTTDRKSRRSNEQSAEAILFLEGVGAVSPATPHKSI